MKAYIGAYVRTYEMSVCVFMYALNFMHVCMCYVYWFIDYNCNIALLIECYMYVCVDVFIYSARLFFGGFGFVHWIAKYE